MKVLISEGDWISRERIVELTNQVNGIRIRLEKADALELITTIRKTRPHVVILGIQLTNGNIINVLKNIHCLQPLNRLIVLVDAP